jgi:hypothetical protein
MKINVSTIRISQACLACDTTQGIQRHHLGCERMWLRHFGAQSRKKRFKDFKARYESFHKDDVRPLCEICHERIHKVYLRIIRVRMEKDYRARLARGRAARSLSDWSWDEANVLMLALRNRGKQWIAAQRKRNELPAITI